MEKIKAILSDILVVGGFGLIVYGVWQVSPPAACMVGGVVLVLVGSLFGLEKKA